MSESEKPSTATVVSAEVFAGRVRALLRPGGVLRAWPRRRLDRWILLHSLARRIEPLEELPEREANRRIQDWLLLPASMLGVDFVTLRRALIDEGFWERDAGGARYRRSPRHERRVCFESPLPDELEILAAGERNTAARRAAHGAPADG